MESKLRRTTLLILIVSVLLLLLGVFDFLGQGDLLLNLGTEALGVVLTVYIIDSVYKKINDEDHKGYLIRQLSNNNNATPAFNEVRRKNWAYDGSLEQVSIENSNLEDAGFALVKMSRARFEDVNLNNSFFGLGDYTDCTFVNTTFEGADFSGASLKGVNFHNCILLNAHFHNIDEQLIDALSLHGTIMPNGSKYDGRYQFPHDIKFFFLRNIDNIPSNCAQYYGISVNEYEEGQSWAKININNFRKKP